MAGYTFCHEALQISHSRMPHGAPCNQEKTKILP